MNIYLITGESLNLINCEVNKIINNSLNVIKYDLRKDLLTDAINEANYFSLTDDQKYLIIKLGDLFKSGSESDLQLLENYLNNPNDKCTVIFISYISPDKRKKIYKLIKEKGKIIEITTLNKKELTYKCMEILKSKGYYADYETASYIVTNSYVNYDIMQSELEKVYLLVKTKNLNIDILKDIISKSLTNTTFDYINAIINHNLENALISSKNFLRLKIDPAMVIIMLYKEYQILLLLKENVRDYEIKNLFHKEEWQMKNYFNNINLYSVKEIKNIIVKLNDYDYKLKKGLLAKEVILDLISMDLCA